MARAFHLPDLGEGLTEGEVARWLVTEGQVVAEDEPLVEIQTDKATVEIPSPYAGTVLTIVVPEGEVAPVGARLVVIGEPGEEIDEPLPKAPSGSEPQGAGRCRRLVQTARRRRRSCGRSPPSSGWNSPLSLRPVPAGASPRTTRAAAGDRAAGQGRREPLRGVRRVIAEHMSRAHRRSPLSHGWRSATSRTSSWTGSRDRGEGRRVVASDFPELNARLDADSIVYLDRYDIGVAVQTAQGLVVPVVRGADGSAVEEIDAEIRRLAEGARAGTSMRASFGVDVHGHERGKLAGLFQTPIVNHPEVAILSIGRIAERPVVREGEVVARRTGTIAVTFDHRVVDGAGGRVRAAGDRATRERRLGNYRRGGGDRSACTGGARGDHEHAERGARVRRRDGVRRRGRASDVDARAARGVTAPPLVGECGRGGSPATRVDGEHRAHLGAPATSGAAVAVGDPGGPATTVVTAELEVTEPRRFRPTTSTRSVEARSPAVTV